MLNFIKSNKIPLFLAILSSLLYLSFAFDLVRSDFIKLISLYAALFFFTFKLIQNSKQQFWLLAGIGIAFRLLFIGAIPNLSQDFYRFLWDGRLLIKGVSPYLFTPEMYMNGSPLVPDNLNFTMSQTNELVSGMGSLNASHFSNYPPINQLFFAITAWFSNQSIIGSVLVLKVIMILADLGILYFGKKLLEKLHIPVHKIFWYLLNPFIIIELTGNLHFEGVMLFFLIWSLYLLYKGKWLLAAVILGVSVSVKLLPLMFLPLFYKFFMPSISSEENNKNIPGGFIKLASFYVLTLVTVLLCFLPFLSSEFISNFSASIGLWFQKFEFNASIYYIIRWIGYEMVGWNIIETVGKILPMIVFTIILGLSFFRLPYFRSYLNKFNDSRTLELFTIMLFAVSAYFLLATTVHPWYIATPLLLCIFTQYRFPIVWSAMVMLSYSAYGSEGFSENLWLVAIEYLTVIGYGIWEVINRRSQLKSLKIK